MTTGSIAPVLKQREADRSPAFVVEVKGAWNYAFTPPYTFMTWYSFTYSNSIAYIFYVHIRVRVLHSCLQHDTPYLIRVLFRINN
jgi:hypothetical protein